MLPKNKTAKRNVVEFTMVYDDWFSFSRISS